MKEEIIEELRSIYHELHEDKKSVMEQMAVGLFDVQRVFEKKRALLSNRPDRLTFNTKRLV